MNFGKTILAASAILLSTYLSAQDKGFVVSSLYFETRVGYEAVMPGMDFDANASGFRGSYLNMRLDGQICEGLTYSYRQRFNKLSDRTFFDATDWIHIDWKATDWFTLGGG